MFLKEFLRKYVFTNSSYTKKLKIINKKIKNVIQLSFFFLLHSNAEHSLNKLKIEWRVLIKNRVLSNNKKIKKLKFNKNNPKNANVLK